MRSRRESQLLLADELAEMCFDAVQMVVVKV
jgi:hypothetical protein